MDCFVENHFRMNECALTCERWLTRGRLCVWTDLSRQQGGAGQPDAGWCHRRHRWRQHRGDDSPGGPEQNQDGKLQPGTHHVQVRTDSSLLTLPVCNSFLFVLLLSGAQMLMWKRKPFRPHTGDSYTCQSLRSFGASEDLKVSDGFYDSVFFAFVIHSAEKLVRYHK